jgi:hypothetical protein
MRSNGCEPKSAILAAHNTVAEGPTHPADRQLQAIAPATPTHVIETVVDQKQATTRGCISPFGQACSSPAEGETGTFILDLPNPPTGRFDAPDADRLMGITAIAMAHRVDQGLLQPQLQTGLELVATHGLQQQIQQRGQLQG